MNTSTNETIIKTNAETYINLLVSIEAGVGMLQIFIGVCDADRQRENIIANYERELALIYHPYRVYLDRQEPSLKKAINKQILDQENAIATVLGAEKLGLFNEDESLKKFFGYLQWTREALREFKMPIILWIPSRIYQQIAKKAPDFWSWRNGVFVFQIEPSFVTNEELIRQTFDFIENDQPSSIFSPEQLETSLAEAINQWGENSSKLGTLYNQLGNLYTNRIKSGKATDRIQELTLAEEYLKQAIVLQTEFQQQENLATSLNNLAGLYRSQGRYNEAESLYLQSLDICKRQLGDDHLDVATSLNNQGGSNSLNGLGNAYNSLGQYQTAIDFHQQSLKIKREIGDVQGEGNSLIGLGNAYNSLGQYQTAIDFYQQSLKITREIGDVRGESNSLIGLGGAYNSLGQYQTAIDFYQQSLKIKREIGDVRGESNSLNGLGNAYNSLGQYQTAIDFHQQSLKIKREIGDVQGEGNS
ncbi:MAG: tetratricopeptide repeat protein, partial [Dolichospermum sp.]